MDGDRTDGSAPERRRRPAPKRANRRPPAAKRTGPRPAVRSAPPPHRPSVPARELALRADAPPAESAAESLRSASDSCSAASRSLDAAGESIRAATRSVESASESFGAAAAVRVVLSVRPSWPLNAPWGRAPSGLLLPGREGVQRRSRRPRWRRRDGGGGDRRGGSERWSALVDRRSGPADRRAEPSLSPLTVLESGRERRRVPHRRPLRDWKRRPRTRRGGRRVLRAASWALIALGVLALIDAVVTMVWQEPVSAVYATIQQDNLGGALRALDSAQPSEAVAARLALLRTERQRIALLAQQLEATAPGGSAVGRITIPRIGISYAVVKGTDTEDLESGPGIYSHNAYPGSYFPGLPGITAIAGHRTTFLAPFRHIDALRPGDTISLAMPYARFTYSVARTIIVKPNDVGAVLRPGGQTRLVLSSCNPPFSAEQRILVYADLAGVTPRGAARAYLDHLEASSTPHSALAAELGLPNGSLTESI